MRPQKINPFFMIDRHRKRASGPRCFWGAIALIFWLFAPSIGLAQSPIFSGCEVNYPPFCIVEKNGRANGFSVELLKASLLAMGKEVIFRTGRWAEVKGWLEKGEVQVLPMVGRTPEREEIFDFTFPYISLHGAIVVRHNTKGIQDLSSLNGKEVAVMRGDNAEEFMRRRERGIKLVLADTFQEALQDLSKGRHDAVVVQRLVATRLIQEASIKGLRIVNRPIEGFRQDFCFAVKKGDSKMLALLNEGLSLVMADGTYRHLHARWFAALELPSRRIIIGGDHDYPPYEYLDENGRPAGHNVELTRSIAQKMGLDIEIRLGPWSRTVQQLARGEIDVIQGMFYSPRRDLTFDFTQPYQMSHYVAVVRKESAFPPNSLEELAGKRIALQRGDVIHDFLLEKGMGEYISLAETQKEVLTRVSDGRSDCAVVVRISAMHLIEKRGWTHLSLGRRPLFSLEYCYAVSNGQKALLAQFSEGLKVVKQTGEYRRIHEKWLGIYEDMGPTWPMALRYAGIVIGGLLLILFVMSLWSWSLKKQVAAKTHALSESEASLRIASSLARLGGWSVEVGPTLKKFREAENSPSNTKTRERGLLGDNARVVWTEEGAAIHEMPPGFSPEVEQEIAFYAPEFRERIAQAFVGCAKEGISYDEEMQIVTGKGARIWVRVFGKAERDISGRIIRIRGGLQDITERKRTEQHIEHLNKVLRTVRDINQLIVGAREQETMLREACRLLVENRGYLSALIVLTDHEERPISWQKAGPEEESGPLEEMLAGGLLPPCCKHIREIESTVLLEERETVCKECPIAWTCLESQSLCVRLSHGDVRFGYLTASVEKDLPVDEEEQGLFLEMANDLAYALYGLKREEEHRQLERRRETLEGRLMQVQKMESIGRLAGGVAHDYNNMLSVILGYTEMALQKAGPGSALHEDLLQILDAGKRSAEITRQLLAFARKQTIHPKIVDLNEIVEGTLKMIRRLIGEEIHLVWVPGARLWKINMDPAQIDQIMANLCLNARDAISGVGRITIETGNVVFDEMGCTGHIDAAPGEFVMLSVIDEGCGMDPQTLSMIFEPFFTTKQPGKGTGLGLSTVYGIVKQNNGSIGIHSEPGKGTKFEIYFPRHVLEKKDAVVDLPQGIPLGKGETILLVEDDPMLIGMGVSMLEKFGYRVLAANTPSKALALAREHPDNIHLLLSDVVMPEMNGREMACRLQAICPDIKILFMSGYTADVIAPHGVLEEGVSFIPKPFSMQALAKKVREMLKENS